MTIERVQTGVRLEKRLVKVLKALAEHRDMSLGDLIEGILLHAFEGRTPFSAATLETIGQLKRIYEMELAAADSHGLAETGGRADDEPSCAQPQHRAFGADRPRLSAVHADRRDPVGRRLAHRIRYVRVTRIRVSDLSRWPADRPLTEARRRRLPMRSRPWSPAGASYLSELTEDAFADMIEGWKLRVDAWLVAVKSDAK
ncbi:hypothetical protein [Mesorhizobium sp. M1365]|uniref:hypothetical protein n=1 Tax=Mesorhizobium sp. M1365 TaxID=2957090 RepID=UPI003337127A